LPVRCRHTDTQRDAQRRPPNGMLGKARQFDQQPENADQNGNAGA